MRLWDKGFTLLELMVAMAILLIAILGILGVFINSILLSEANTNLVMAVNDAQYVLEQIKGLSFQDIDSYEPPEFNNLNNEDIPKPTVNEITSRLKEVTVNVNWTQRNRNRNFQLSTRIAK